MRWCRKLYLDEGVSGSASAVRAALEEGEYGKLYIITLSYQPSDQLDIRPASSLRHSYLRDKGPMIAGVCSSREKAIEMVGRIASDCFLENNNYDMRAYLTALEDM